MDSVAKGYQFTVIMDRQPEGGYLVTVPALPGCYTKGRTLKKAHEMAADAIRAYCASLLKHGAPIPTDVFCHREHRGHRERPPDLCDLCGEKNDQHSRGRGVCFSSGPSTNAAWGCRSYGTAKYQPLLPLLRYCKVSATAAAATVLQSINHCCRGNGTAKY